MWGGRRDPLTGLDYLRARNYDSAQGIFTSVDPFRGFDRIPFASHDYVYAFANPTKFNDPSGQTPLLISTLKAAGITVGIGSVGIAGTLGYVKLYKGVSLDEDFFRAVWERSVDRFFETNAALSPFTLVDGDLADYVLFGGRFGTGLITGGAVAETVGGATIFQYLNGHLLNNIVLLGPGSNPWWNVYTFGQFMKGMAVNALASTVILELGLAIGSIAGGIVDAADEIVEEQNASN